MSPNRPARRVVVLRLAAGNGWIAVAEKSGRMGQRSAVEAYSSQVAGFAGAWLLTADR